MLFSTVVIGVYVTILVANMGGYVDEIFKSEIQETVGAMIQSGAFRDLPPEMAKQAAEQMIWAMEEGRGLHEPFLSRSIRWLWRGLTLDLGQALRISAQNFRIGTISEVYLIILSGLPTTLLLFGTGNILLFLASVSVALGLSKRYGSLLDKIMVAISPISSAPSWFYGVILIAVFAANLHWLPFGGMYDTLPPSTKFGYIFVVLKHMILPVASIFLSLFFQSVYAWRTFFLIYAGEDYVEMAKAKGLPRRLIERDYILRPTLPNLLTSFAMMLISFWSGAALLEIVFDWPGLGVTFLRAVRFFDTPLIVGFIIIYAYLLAISVFILDIVYAIVDPRVNVRTGESNDRRAYRKFNFTRWLTMALRRARLPQIPKEFDKHAQVVPLIQDTQKAVSSFAEQSRQRYIKSIGRRLAAAGLIAQEQDVFWLTRGELLYLATTLRAGKKPSSLRRFVNRRKAQCNKAWQIAGKNGLGKRAHTEGQEEGHKEMPKELLRVPRLKNLIKDFLHYPSAVLGIVIILSFVVYSIVAVVVIPYDQAISLWRGEEMAWLKTPKNALPAWVNLFRIYDLPENMHMDTRDGSAVKVIDKRSDEVTRFTTSFRFNYQYSDYPEDVVIFPYPKYDEKIPYLSMVWITPDGREIKLADINAKAEEPMRVSQQASLKRKLKSEYPQKALFSSVEGDNQTPVKGIYELRIEGMVFEPESDIDVEVVIFGKVYGLAGTDNLRRDLMVALLWGAPVALAFGVLAATFSTIASMVFAALGAWYGGWVDDLIQRLTEINMILPLLPMLFMVTTLYSHSIWLILGVTVALSIFGSGIKNYRAVFMQIKEAPYLEAAQAYGAGDWRLVIRYLVPRIIPVLVPQLVLLVPGYVFIEASLALMGLSDPILPTWGKIISDAYENKALYTGQYYWVLEPAFLLMLVGLAFALLGFALDRILNPRLREI